MTVRLWEEKDIPAIAIVERECFSMPRSEEEFFREYKSGAAIYCLALKDGGIWGYGGYYPVLDEGYVANIAVRENARGRGAGKAVVRFLLEHAKKQGLSFLSLEVRKSNAAAIALYEGAGFVLVGERRDFYEKPAESALLYTYFFKGSGSF